MREELDEVALLGAPVLEEAAEFLHVGLTLLGEDREAVVRLLRLAHPDHLPFPATLERAADERLRLEPRREKCELDVVARRPGVVLVRALPRERIRLLEHDRAIGALAKRLAERCRLVLEPDEGQAGTIGLHDSVLVMLHLDFAPDDAAAHRVLLLFELEAEDGL